MHSSTVNRLAGVPRRVKNPMLSDHLSKSTDRCRSKDDIQLVNFADGGGDPSRCWRSNDIAAIIWKPSPARQRVSLDLDLPSQSTVNTWKKEEREGKLSLGLAAAITASRPH